jgi:hypothetical protein
VTIVPERSNPKPTATHAAAPGHATPLNPPPPGAFDVVSRLQLRPSQRSATVKVVLELATLWPTAVQAEADEHETLFKNAACEPVGFGVDCTVHFVPFHCSASVIPPLGLVDPTAEQAEAEVHATENSAAPGLAPVGVAWMFQLVPFQRSASEPWSDNPTATQALDERQAIPDSWLNCTPAGLGVGCTAQAAPLHRSASVTWTPELFV